MKKYSREELDEALEALKKMRKEEAYSGVLPHHFASCYMPAPSYRYNWDKIPGEYICPTCGEVFGKLMDPDVPNEGRRRGFDFGDRVVSGSPNEEVKFSVDTWNFDAVLRNLKECTGAGYDAKIEVNCADCIVDNKVPPIAFYFHASESDDYTVSYPILGDKWTWKEKKSHNPPLTKDNQFFPHEYYTATSFLKEVPHIAGKKRCRDWLREIERGTTYEGQPWSVIFNALRGILGFSTEE